MNRSDENKDRNRPGRHKGQPGNEQKGAATVSKTDAGKHEKDESGGAAENTTKKQGNSI